MKKPSFGIASAKAGQHADSASLMARPTQYIGVAQEDLERIAAMDLPLAACVVEAGADGIVAQDGARALAPDEIYARITGLVAFGASSQARLEKLRETWNTVYGDMAPELLDLSRVAEKNRKAEMLTWLVQILAGARAVQAGRNQRLSRDLFELRRNHESMQTSFRALEQFFYDTVKFERWRDFILPPVAGQGDCVMINDAVVIQRLPRGSVGLSDIVLEVAGPAPSRGTLRAVLKSLDERRPLAIWTIQGSQLRAGELRLALHSALGDDKVSLSLELEWEGDRPLHLKTSLPHPDVRFQLHMDAQPRPVVLAMQGYRYVAGALAPVPAGAFVPQGSMAPMRLVPPSVLAGAVNLKTGRPDLEFLNEAGALQVHVAKGELAAGVLRSVCAPGLRQVTARIETGHENAPEIEYALAVLARDKRSGTTTERFDLDAGHFSGWVRLAPLVPGELRLEIPEGLEEEGDLYMLTRLPEGVERIDHGWSRFSNLVLRYSEDV